jgi:hypothetical protein
MERALEELKHLDVELKKLEGKNLRLTPRPSCAPRASALPPSFRLGRSFMSALANRLERSGLRAPRKPPACWSAQIQCGPQRPRAESRWQLCKKISRPRSAWHAIVKKKNASTASMEPKRYVAPGMRAPDTKKNLSHRRVEWQRFTSYLTGRFRIEPAVALSKHPWIQVIDPAGISRFVPETAAIRPYLGSDRGPVTPSLAFAKGKLSIEK